MRTGPIGKLAQQQQCRSSGRYDLTTRTTRTTVSFSSPFTLRSLEGVQPAGEYVILSDDEKASNTVMQICVSRAKSERLVLDL